MMKRRVESGSEPPRPTQAHEKELGPRKDIVAEHIALGPADDTVEVDIYPAAEMEVPSSEAIDFSLFGTKATLTARLYAIAYDVARLPFVIDHITNHAERRAWEARLEARGGYENDLSRTRNNKLSINKLGQGLQAIAKIKSFAGKITDQNLLEELEQALRREPSADTLIKELKNMEDKTIDEKIKLAKDVEAKIIEYLAVLAEHLPRQLIPPPAE